MKKCSIFLSSLVALFLFAGIAKAQVFMVVKGETSTPYNDLEEAVAAAEEGSTVYIPTGPFTIKGSPSIAGSERANTLLIDKPLTLIGAGTDEGTLHATVITGAIVLTAAASGSVLEGFALAGSGLLGMIRLDDVSNVLINRCRLSAVALSGTGDGILVRESQLDGVGGTGSIFANWGFAAQADNFTKVMVLNCVLTNIQQYLREAIYSNNIITFGNPYQFQNVHQCLILNNIFTTGTNVDAYSSSYNSFTYNVSVGSFSEPVMTQYNSTGFNIENIPLMEIFGTNSPAYNRYKLAESSPAKGAGADGTDAGIYGGPMPAKELRLPSIPQVVEYTVAGMSNPDGTLKVNIKVEAQSE